MQEFLKNDGGVTSVFREMEATCQDGRVRLNRFQEGAKDEQAKGECAWGGPSLFPQSHDRHPLRADRRHDSRRSSREKKIKLDKLPLVTSAITKPRLAVANFLFFVCTGVMPHFIGVA